jgi:mono/diheme cytochrome c family protein
MDKFLFRLKNWRPVSFGVWAAMVALIAFEARANEAQTPDFARDIYPILRRACFECHGPEVQEADLRFDDRDAALQHYSAIVPSDAESSEIYRRVTLPAGHDEIMPAVGKPLSQQDAESLRRWLESGAEWPKDFKPEMHWAYVAPVRPSRPEVSDPTWPRGEIDYFILSRLDSEGLEPSPEAERTTLIRRVYLDLVGLPPSPAEVEAFLADSREIAYEQIVDRLLASPQFGERWARPWLDLARYADSHGYQRDDLREIWSYRDWVIQALNADMPFDQFTIEQLAGDLLPDATESQKVATGFHRCTMTNVEAGTDPEENRTNQIIDRVNTTATVWLGSTLECAQCHDHKYDSFSQKEYFQLYAFFNNTVIEADRANAKVPASIRFLGPSMTLNDEEDKAERLGLRRALKEISRQIEGRMTEVRRDSGEWESELRQLAENAPQAHVLKLDHFATAEGAGHRTLDDSSVLLTDDPPDTDVYTFTAKTDLQAITAFKLEALTDDTLPGSGPGRSDARRPNFVLNEFSVELAPAGSNEFTALRFSKAIADYSQPRFDVAFSIDNDPKTGWGIARKFFVPHWAVFQTVKPLAGESRPATFRFKLVQSFGGGRTIGRLRVSAITGDPTADDIPADIARIIKLAPDSRSAVERRQLNNFQFNRDEQIASLRKERSALQAKLRRIEVPSTLVMQELPEPRTTKLFERGDFRQPDEVVAPGVPHVLHSFTPVERDRYGLAQWLVDGRNPLVGRVTVNRWWAEIFGHGIVETAEDFGIKGALPSHPAVLDWLAVEFVESGWSMKHVLREIVTSATYRQSSRITPELLQRDDKNKLYARGPRLRLSAEAIRDNALSISGLLSTKQFGPPIRPYQPDGLWIKVGGARVDYEVSPGEDRYRRGIYVVLKRSAPYPSFVNFDASARLACTTRRSRSNTPLQALTLLNDPVYVETALALAVRTLRETPKENVDGRIAHMVGICLCRDPKPLEVTALRRLFDAQLHDARSDRKSTRALVGKVALPSDVTRPELAAWNAVAMVLMNLDETITKN